MRNPTATRLAQAIQLLKLDGFVEYTNIQLANAAGVSAKTITRNKDLIIMLDFALHIERH